ncbi:MAG: TonB family protein [Selenomonadaceae bacterium]|nr:TonB family protein [Selenomonadaceae bacterium]
MTESVSWRKAAAWSGGIHLIVVAILAYGLTDYAEHHPPIEYVIDLDAMDFEQGSGSAGGGASAASDLFPAPLAQTEINDRLEEATKPVPASPLAPIAPPIAPPISETPTPPSADSIPIPTADNPTPTASSSGASSIAAPVSDTGIETGGLGATGSDSVASGFGSGVGESSGEGEGSGEGLGIGDGTGDSEVSGSGSAPFDFNGFAGAVEANKSYPYMAMRRGIEGSVTMSITLDSAGNLSSLSVVSSDNDLLNDAALQAVRSACPYPNPSGVGVSFTTTLHFYLQ